MTMLSRDLVAKALSVDADSLPPGDLPLDRLAQRLLGYLRDTADDDPSEEALREHPDAWTYALSDALCETHPDIAFDLVRDLIRICASPDDIALVAAGPLEDLIVQHGPDLIAAIEQEAAGSDRFRFALSGVWQRDANPFVWARVEAARANGPDLDAGDPLPPA